MSTPSKSRDHAALIDPYGIYGTRTAARLRNMRRRQRAQQIVLALIVLALIVIGIYSLRANRILSLKSNAAWSLLVAPSATPAWDPVYQNLLIPTRDGQIVATWPLSHPVRSRILLETDFPIHTAPIMDEKYFYSASENGVLYALNRQTGKRMWHYDSGTSISTQPQVLGNLVFGGNDAGWLFCLRAKNGELVWRRKLPSAIGNGLATVSHPTKLVLAPLTDGGAQRGGVWAFDANNGSIKWKFPGKGLTNAQQVTPPVTVDIDGKTRVFCANDTGALVNLNAANGKYGGSDDGWKVFFQHEKANAQLMLRQPPVLEPQTSPTRLYLVGSDDVVRCVDIYTGRLLWKWQSPAIVTANIQLAARQILVPCRGSVSYLLNANTGEMEARIKGNSNPFVSMLRIEQRIWAMDSQGTLLRFTLSN